MKHSEIDKIALSKIFLEARTHHHWLKNSVSDEFLHSLYDLTKWAPTSMNSAPMRIVFLKSEESKTKLYPALKGSNLEQVKQAPVTAIIAYDEKFYEHLPKLFPVYDAKPIFAGDKNLSEATAFRNSSLQGGYLMLAARALGLDVGPMSGFDTASVDDAFFKNTTWRTNFLCNLGYGDSSKLYPRGPRLDFNEVCQII